MKTRVLSGLIMLPPLIILVLGGYVLFAGCFVIGIMGVREFYNGFREMDIKPNYGIACVAASSLYIINLFCEKPEWYMLCVFRNSTGEPALPVQYRTQEAGGCNGNDNGYILCRVFLIPCNTGGSGRTLPAIWYGSS